jgi:hypothetical protein
MRRRNEPAPDEGGLTDSPSTILKELRFLKKEMASNKAEVDERLAVITQNIRSAADQDKASSARTASKETIERLNASPQRPSQKQGSQRQ